MRRFTAGVILGTAVGVTGCAAGIAWQPASLPDLLGDAALWAVLLLASL